MSILSNGSQRIYINTVDPTPSEAGAELGNFWENTTTNEVFVCADATFGAQIWLSATSAGFTQITGDSGGPQVPLAGNFNIFGSGSITTVGTANTETVQLTGLTANNVLVGAGTTTITKVAPTATIGIPLVSQGAAVDPIFGTASVAGGGTGTTTLTGVLTGNGTAAFTASPVSQHGVVVGGASNLVATTAVGLTGQVLQGNTGLAPTYSVATYPSTTTINQLLYSSAADVVTGLPTLATAILTTDAGGIPSLTAAPLTVPYGGTGNTSFSVVNGVICAGTTTTGPLQVTATAGTLGQRLVSQGAAAIPIFQSTPSFMAFLNANATNLFNAGIPRVFSINGLYAVPASQVTVDHDITGSFDATTGIFTAPITGVYSFTSSWQLSGLGGADDHLLMEFVTSVANRTFQQRRNLGDTRIPGINQNSATMTGSLRLTVGDTVFARGTMVLASGNAFANGLATVQESWFSGYLVTPE